MTIPTRTEISDYAALHGLKVEIRGPKRVPYVKGDVMEVIFDHPPSTDDGTANFKVRSAMSFALDTDGGVYYGSNMIVFYHRDPPGRDR